MMRMTFGETIPTGSKPVSDEELLRIVTESRWQLGTGVLGGVQLPMERKKTLGKYLFRHAEKVLATPVEKFTPHEWMDWRGDECI
jgi:hypothetical protein